MPTKKIERIPLPENMFELALEEARDIRADGLTTQRVHVPESVDVALIRGQLGLTQAAFAARFGFGLRAVRQWEQGQRRPEGPAKVLLAMIAADAKGVLRLIKKAGLAA